MPSLVRLTIALVCCSLLASMTRADDWPQWLGPKRDSIWRETGLLERFLAGGPKIRWRAPIGFGYSGAAVAQGKVVITDRVLTEGIQNPANGFVRNRLDGQERVLCLDEATGQVLWKHPYKCTYEVGYPAGPRCTPVIDGASVYTLGAMGDLLCLELATGKVVWSRNFPNEFGTRINTWGFAAHPLVDGNKLICVGGGKDGIVVALDKATGKELWHAVPAVEIGYCPPMIYEAGGKRQLIVWHPMGIASLDPETGKEYWKEPWKLHQSAMSISTPRFENGLLFFTSFYNGSMMLKLDDTKPAETVLWKGKWWAGGRNTEQPQNTEGLHSIIVTPFLLNGYIYGVCSYGELRCLKAETGERLWATHAPVAGKSERWGTAFLVRQDDRFFLFNEKGDLIIANLTPKGYEEISRAHILDPQNVMAGRPVIWSHPAFANKAMYARNDAEMVCVGLSKEENSER